MTLTLHEQNGSKVMIAEGGMLSDVQDALDLMATARHQYDCDKILLPVSAVTPAFFDLRTGIAGEILQKYTNYGVQVAFVGDFSQYTSKALRDFIRESNRGGRVLFLDSRDAALEALHGG